MSYVDKCEECGKSNIVLVSIFEWFLCENCHEGINESNEELD